MYLHLGQDLMIKTDEIIGIFDLDSSTVSARTRDFLRKMQENDRIITAGDDLPKSFIVCRGKSGTIVYLTQVAPSTLVKRMKGF